VMEMDVCNERDMNLLLNFSDGPGGFLIDHSDPDDFAARPLETTDLGDGLSYVTCIRLCHGLDGNRGVPSNLDRAE